MATAVSSSSPLSLITSGAAAPATAAASGGAATTTDGSGEATDFNAVLSPMLNSAEAGAAVAGAALVDADGSLATTETPVSTLPLALPEGLELTTVLQQSMTAKGNALPVDGKTLPGTADDAATAVVEEGALQTAVTTGGDASLQLQTTQSSEAKATKDELTGDDLLAQLAAPAAIPPTTTTDVIVDTPTDVASTDATTNTDVAVDAQAAQQALLMTMPQTVVNPAQPDDGISTGDAEAAADTLATTALASNSRSVALRTGATADTTPSLNASDDAADSTPSTALTDMLSLPTETGKDADTTKSAGFERLLEAQAGANTSGSQSSADSAVLNTRPLTGAVAYRMDGNTQVATALVNQPLDTPQWTNEIGERVVWFGANKIHNAEIALDPPELGPLQVRITTQNDQTSVTFTSHHAAVREVLDQSLPKLKEMFSEQGLNLVQADVGDRRGSQQQQAFNTGDSSANASDNSAGDEDIDAPIAATSSATKMRLGLVDAYA